ncbi:MAG: uL13 family ribosomal protein, partial [Candidatus Marinimicrobia bacterium]|nr:uL13 family ribosomal protein [Candidatus Neomarinimicrobiota bacterium]
MKTFVLKGNDIKKDWYLADADNQVLGRLAARIAAVLRGKHKPTFSP